MIFVFGSNLMGIHGAGAALDAHTRGFPLHLGVGIHWPSMCYALPSKESPTYSLKSHVIKLYVAQLCEFGNRESNHKFQITRVGCGLAGFSDFEMAIMFEAAGYPPNFLFDTAWKPYLGANADYWGTYP